MKTISQRTASLEDLYSDITLKPQPGNEHEQRQENVRRWVVRLVFLIYWLLIFEGVLRKWVFPQFFQPLFFIKDPFVMLVYWLVLRYRLWKGRAPLLIFAMSLSMVSLVPLFINLLSDDFSPIIYFYGWRNYFYYIPLAFVIGGQFREADLKRLVRHTLLVAIPIAGLVFLQFVSPPNSPINTGAVDDLIIQLGVTAEVARTYGTFTSTVGQSQFIGSVVAMLLAVWIMPRGQRPMRGFILVIISGAVVTNLAVSGSRTAYSLSLIILVVAILSGLILSKRKLKLRATVVPLGVAIVALGLILTVFQSSFQALQERFIGAYEVESQQFTLGFVGRAIDDMTRFATVWLPETPPLGYGIGVMGNANSDLAYSVLRLSNQAEDDFSRNIVELGPALGLLFIFFRLALVFWLTKGAINATRRTNNPLPLLLIGFIGISLFYGQITGNGQLNGYGWLFAGFCIAANRLGEPVFDQSDKLGSNKVGKR